MVYLLKKHKDFIKEIICWLSGTFVGVASMIYLSTIPAILTVSSMLDSQAYVITNLGLLFFGCLMGMCVAMFIKYLVFELK